MIRSTAFLAAMLCSAAPPLRPASAGDDALPALLKNFLRAVPANRGTARRALLDRSDLNVDQIERELQTLDLWSDQPVPISPVQVGPLGEDGKFLAVHFRLPKDYAPARSWPLILTLHGTGDHAAKWLPATVALLGRAADGFIIAAPEDLDGPGFIEPAPRELRPRRLVAALRKLFHVDGDRVLITGYSLGGHRSFIAVSIHPDLFAGAMPLAGTLALPLNDLLFEPMLANTRGVPILVVWGERDVDFGITPRNRMLRDMAKTLNMPRFTPIELPGIGHLGVRPPADLLHHWLASRRPPRPTTISHAFRVPAVSRDAWIRALQPWGEPIPTTTLRVRPAPGEDPAHAMLEYVRRHIGRIEAKIDGQTIELTTQGCASVELALTDSLIDLDQPIRVIRRKKVLFEGVVPRDPGAMLEAAAAEWDFERLPQALLMVRIAGESR